jgi:predicted nucleic-acid-binding protein
VIALDACVLARLILGDDPAQQEAAARFLRDNECSVGWSVLVELCWVLERSAMLPREQTVAGLRMLGAIEEIVMPDAERFDWAVSRYEHGADFPDMVHLVSVVGGSEGFGTFDRKLARQAGSSAPLDIISVPA